MYNLGIFCSCTPWFYGPYGQQSLLLAQYFHGREVDRLRLPASAAAAASSTAKNAVVPGDELPPQDGRTSTSSYKVTWFVYERSALPEAETAKYPWITFVRIGAAPWIYVSEMNKEFSRYGIHGFVTMMDMNRIFVDEAFQPVAVSWFPNHWEKLDIHSRHALSQFDAVCPLAPSDAERIQKQLPHKAVTHVPHVIREWLPEGAGSSGEEDGGARARRRSRSTAATKSNSKAGNKKAELRRRFRIPESAFVILVLFSNYDKANNRKNPDLSLSVFKEVYLEAARNGTAAEQRPFLFVHALKSEKLMQEHSAERQGVPLNLILDALDLHKMPGCFPPTPCFHVNENELAYKDILDLPKMADLFLHPAKAEGFGLPVLEAQLAGVPVVVNGFGAMKDFALYGTAVPPNGPVFMELGMAATPDYKGLVAAVRDLMSALKSSAPSGDPTDERGGGEEDEDQDEDEDASGFIRDEELSPATSVEIDAGGRTAQTVVRTQQGGTTGPSSSKRKTNSTAALECREVRDSKCVIFDAAPVAGSIKRQVGRNVQELERARRRAQEYIAANLSLEAVGGRFHHVFQSVSKPDYSALFRIFSYGDRVPVKLKCKWAVIVAPGAYVVDQDRLAFLMLKNGGKVLFGKEDVDEEVEVGPRKQSPRPTRESTSTSGGEEEEHEAVVVQGLLQRPPVEEDEENTVWVGSHHELAGGESPRFVSAHGEGIGKIGAPVQGMHDDDKDDAGLLPTVMIHKKQWKRILQLKNNLNHGRNGEGKRRSKSPARVLARDVLTSIPYHSKKEKWTLRYAGIVGVRRPTQQWQR